MTDQGPWLTKTILELESRVAELEGQLRDAVSLPLEVWLGKGDKLVGDIYADDGYSFAGVGIFEPEEGRKVAIGKPESQIDGMPIRNTNAIVLIKSTRPESLQVMIDELTEAMERMRADPPHTKADQ